MGALKRFLIFNIDDRRKELEFDLDLRNDKAIIDFGALQDLLDKISMYPFEYKIVGLK